MTSDLREHVKVEGSHLGERLKLVEVLDGTEELEADAGRDDEEAHGEEDETAQLLARTKDLTQTVTR